ncbi:esterase family protein [Bacillaceae bacterium Marseille-Q3522]|nr:esterase family protein [Bacillaceae bacterium Marseille-Q3522]
MKAFIRFLTLEEITLSFPRGNLSSRIFFSKELNEEMELLIYLPANYSELQKYSILITQDGRDYFQMGRIGRLADELLFNKKIENLIIVGIPYKSVDDRRIKYHPDGKQNKAYIRFLAHELVPYLDGEFSTYQVGYGRALAGDSLGATVSLMTALLYPHTFGKVILQSPLVNHKVLQAAASLSQDQLLQIYHVIGKKETEVKTSNGEILNFLTPNRELAKIFRSKKLDYYYQEFDGNHTWTFWQPDLKVAVPHLFSL